MNNSNGQTVEFKILDLISSIGTVEKKSNVELNKNIQFLKKYLGAGVASGNQRNETLCSQEENPNSFYLIKGIK